MQIFIQKFRALAFILILALLCQNVLEASMSNVCLAPKSLTDEGSIDSDILGFADLMQLPEWEALRDRMTQAHQNPYDPLVVWDRLRDDVTEQYEKAKELYTEVEKTRDVLSQAIDAQFQYIFTLKKIKKSDFRKIEELRDPIRKAGINFSKANKKLVEVVGVYKDALSKAKTFANAIGKTEYQELYQRFFLDQLQTLGEMPDLETSFDLSKIQNEPLKHFYLRLRQENEILGQDEKKSRGILREAQKAFDEALQWGREKQIYPYGKAEKDWSKDLQVKLEKIQAAETLALKAYQATLKYTASPSQSAKKLYESAQLLLGDIKVARMRLEAMQEMDQLLYSSEWKEIRNAASEDRLNMNEPGSLWPILFEDAEKKLSLESGVEVTQAIREFETAVNEERAILGESGETKKIDLDALERAKTNVSQCEANFNYQVAKQRDRLTALKTRLSRYLYLTSLFNYGDDQKSIEQAVQDLMERIAILEADYEKISTQMLGLREDVFILRIRKINVNDNIVEPLIDKAVRLFSFAKTPEQKEARTPFNLETNSAWGIMHQETVDRYAEAYKAAVEAYNATLQYRSSPSEDQRAAFELASELLENLMKYPKSLAEKYREASSKAEVCEELATQCTGKLEMEINAKHSSDNVLGGIIEGALAVMTDENSKPEKMGSEMDLLKTILEQAERSYESIYKRNMQISNAYQIKQANLRKALIFLESLKKIAPDYHPEELPKGMSETLKTVRKQLEQTETSLKESLRNQGALSIRRDYEPSCTQMIDLAQKVEETLINRLIRLIEENESVRVDFQIRFWDDELKGALEVTSQRVRQGFEMLQKARAYKTRLLETAGKMTATTESLLKTDSDSNSSPLQELINKLKHQIKAASEKPAESLEDFTLEARVDLKIKDPFYSLKRSIANSLEGILKGWNQFNTVLTRQRKPLRVILLLVMAFSLRADTSFRNVPLVNLPTMNPVTHQVVTLENQKSQAGHEEASMSLESPSKASVQTENSGVNKEVEQDKKQVIKTPSVPLHPAYDAFKKTRPLILDLQYKINRSLKNPDFSNSEKEILLKELEGLRSKISLKSPLSRYLADLEKQINSLEGRTDDKLKYERTRLEKNLAKGQNYLSQIKIELDGLQAKLGFQFPSEEKDGIEVPDAETQGTIDSAA